MTSVVTVKKKQEILAKSLVWHMARWFSFNLASEEIDFVVSMPVKVFSEDLDAQSLLARDF